MKEIKIKDQEKENKSWVLPGKSLSREEFIAGIREAEEGPFHSVHESMENFELWVTMKEKK